MLSWATNFTGFTLEANTNLNHERLERRIARARCQRDEQRRDQRRQRLDALLPFAQMTVTNPRHESTNGRSRYDIIHTFHPEGM